VAMVIHELTTNAVKYGALSLQGGHVSACWSVTDEHPPPTLVIQWVEAGGPKVTAPTQQGYGSSVIRELLSYELGGSVDLVFARDGVRCTISLPTSRNVERFG
jgi:two-component system, chemotaxis family, CheB/CheR fusion protein